MQDPQETINKVRAHTYPGMNRKARRAAAKKQGAFKHPGLFSRVHDREVLDSKTRRKGKRGRK